MSQAISQAPQGIYPKPSLMFLTNLVPPITTQTDVLSQVSQTLTSVIPPTAVSSAFPSVANVIAAQNGMINNGAMSSALSSLIDPTVVSSAAAAVTSALASAPPTVSPLSAVSSALAIVVPSSQLPDVMSAVTSVVAAANPSSLATDDPAFFSSVLSKALGAIGLTPMLPADTTGGPLLFVGNHADIPALQSVTATDTPAVPTSDLKPGDVIPTGPSPTSPASIVSALDSVPIKSVDVPTSVLGGVSSLVTSLDALPTPVDGVSDVSQALTYILSVPAAQVIGSVLDWLASLPPNPAVSDVSSKLQSAATSCPSDVVQFSGFDVDELEDALSSLSPKYQLKH